MAVVRPEAAKCLGATSGRVAPVAGGFAAYVPAVAAIFSTDEFDATTSEPPPQCYPCVPVCGCGVRPD